jgi:malonyl-CoA/methylmalonyl-CoA synthetase
MRQAEKSARKTALNTTDGRFTYGRLLASSAMVAASLLRDGSDLHESRVAFLIPPGFDYTAVLWGVWRAGGIAVPLSLQQTQQELAHVIEDSDAAVVIANPDWKLKLQPIIKPPGPRVMTTMEFLSAPPASLPEVNKKRRALILYTSGTTGKPKGAVITHRNIEAQVKSLHTAWGWEPDDHILNVLPLNHIHGIINILTCALWAGATCDLLPKFDAQEVWARIMKGSLTLFMAVPTVYIKLIAFWKAAAPQDQKKMTSAASKMRLFVSGSAALPVHVLEDWKSITRHTILERYGMTEIGMALSNPLRGKRVPGYVGTPLPGVQVKLIDDHGRPPKPGQPGEILVRGATVIHEYWRNPEAMKTAFQHGWFRTGDIAIFNKSGYRILGRSSADIIKTGGYKVSALDIEEVLRTHLDIEECAVIGIEDAEWGEVIGAALVLKAGHGLVSGSLDAWARERLATYKIPRHIHILDELPRNSLGKVTKSEVKKLFESDRAARPSGGIRHLSSK